MNHKKSIIFLWYKMLSMQLKYIAICLLSINMVVFSSSPIHAEDKNRDMALIEATKKGDLDVVKHLISEGANVNTQVKHGITVLMVASGKGHLELVKYLVSQGANVNTQNDRGTTAIMWASKRGYTQIVEFLKSKGAKGHRFKKR